jgi:hypothetical protein
MTYEKCSLNIFEMTHNTMKKYCQLKIVDIPKAQKGNIEKNICSFHPWNKHEITFPKIGHYLNKFLALCDHRLKHKIFVHVLVILISLQRCEC